MRCNVWFIFFLILSKCCLAQLFPVYNYTAFSEKPELLNQLRANHVYFLGEEHGVKETDVAEARMIELIGHSNARILLEGPYERNFGLYEVFVEHDSSNYQIESFHPYKTNLLRFIYNNNLPVKTMDIVMLSQFRYFALEIKDLYKTKQYGEQVSRDLELLISASENYRYGKADSLDLYLLLIAEFGKHKAEHEAALGKRYGMVEECFGALKAAVMAYKEKDKLLPYHSNAREDFMFSVFSKEINQNPQSKLISVNGQDHISLDSTMIPLDFVHKSWRPLCHKIKAAYPNKKVCSIYLVKRNHIGFFKKVSHKDYRNLYRLTRRHTTYIVPLTEAGSAFKDLKNKVNHIVVY